MLSFVARAVYFLNFFLNTCQLASDVVVLEGLFQRHLALFADLLALHGTIVYHFALQSAHKPLIIDSLVLQIGKFELLSVSG